MTSDPEPLVIAEPELLMPIGQRFVLNDAMFDPDDPKPIFTVQEAAKFFFGKGADWLRWRSRPSEGHPQGLFVLDGEPIVPRRTPSGARYYTLPDIERMAHALAQNGGIDGGAVSQIILLVKTCAKVYNVL